MAYPRSPNDREGGLVYFPRMLNKMRLHLKGELTEDYHRLRGNGFDAACCGFLGVNYDDVLQQVENGKEDAEALTWCFENGREPREQDINMFNDYMSKRGWRDGASERLAEIASNFSNADNIHTFFDLIEADEERM
jgi:gluconokinase